MKKVSGATLGILDELSDRNLCVLVGDPHGSHPRPAFNITIFPFT